MGQYLKLLWHGNLWGFLNKKIWQFYALYLPFSVKKENYLTFRISPDFMSE